MAQEMKTQSYQQCDVKSCDRPANFKCSYDCDDDIGQVIQVCKEHYESHDVLPSGERFYYFKEFTKNIEVLTS